MLFCCTYFIFAKSEIFVFSSKIHFREKRIFAFLWAIFAKNENDFCSYFREIFAKIYFRPNSNPASPQLTADRQSSGGLPPGMALGCELTSVRGNRGENYENT
jgi:hypothetical protein